MAFVIKIDELIELFDSKKHNILRYLRKNFKESYHYIKDVNFKNERQGRGGQNCNSYLLTEECFNLVKNSYNLRNRYFPAMSDTNVKCVNIVMCIENSTIGFIENSFQGLLDMKRQQIFDKYRVDLFFPEFKLIIECDEHGHTDRIINEEKIREDFLIGLGNTMIRFNPNKIGFDLSNVLKEIISVVFKGVSANNVIRL